MEFQSPGEPSFEHLVGPNAEFKVCYAFCDADDIASGSANRDYDSERSQSSCDPRSLGCNPKFGWSILDHAPSAIKISPGGLQREKFVCNFVCEKAV